MSKLYYDFHIHSCLSPCGDADMTPNNIVNMAKLKGLDAIALTDHNACGNCAAVMEVGRREGLLVIPGMELCTSEDIHVVCLFNSLEGALAFENEVKKTMPEIENRPDIFGEQLVLDADDNETAKETMLLITSAGIGVNEASAICRSFEGAAFPAHADKQANGIIGILGAIPPEAGFKTAELSSNCDVQAFTDNNPSLKGLKILTDSDAHYIWQISERKNYIELDNIDTVAILNLINN